MPCTFTGSLDGDRAMHARESLDAMTDRLCTLCNVLENRARQDLIAAAGLTDWWRRHQLADAARKKSARDGAQCFRISCGHSVRHRANATLGIGVVHKRKGPRLFVTWEGGQSTEDFFADLIRCDPKSGEVLGV